MFAITSGPAHGTQCAAGEARHDFDDAQVATPGASAQTAVNASPEGHGTTALTGLVPAGGLHPVVDGAAAKGKSKAETIREFQINMMLINAVLAINADPKRPSGLRG